MECFYNGKKTYRNALRSKEMIRSAFLHLLSEKPLERITVADVVERCGLSRNTFFAHYPDVYGVLEDYLKMGLETMSSFLNEAVENQSFDDPLPFLERIAHHVEEKRDIYQVILNAG